MTTVAYKGWDNVLTTWNTGTWNGEQSINNAATASVGQAVLEGDAIISVVPLLLKVGLVLYWLGGMMKPSAPPPGSVSVITNMVLFPGVPTITMPPTGQSEADFAKQWSIMFQIHALTVFGLTTSLTPAGPAMVPIPYPFVSVK